MAATLEERNAIIEECAQECDKWAKFSRQYAATFKGFWNRKDRNRHYNEAYGHANAAATLREMIALPAAQYITMKAAELPTLAAYILANSGRERDFTAARLIEQAAALLNDEPQKAPPHD